MLITALRAIWTWFIVPISFFATLFWAGLAAIFTFFPNSDRAVEWVIRSWSRGFLLISPLRWEVRGAEKLGNGPYVFASNHLGNFDIPLLFLAIPVPIRYLAKKELFRIPIFATGMRRIGIVEVDREAAATARDAINVGVAAAVARGHSIMVYAEGHRSRDRRLQPFKRGAFRIAIDNGLPLVPVTVQGTWEVWPPGKKVVRSGRAVVVIGDPIDTSRMDRSQVGDLLDLARDTIATTYDALRAESAQS
ncbi:MAG: 1-acyl-sn-glycerol-3-phosphate acyltransferase [Acidimicrobiia bacterium]|nr:1-acyl-sn-glycerol-3-phosphate acyltransferase [Acidimicrobiia bacterium]